MVGIRSIQSAVGTTTPGLARGTLVLNTSDSNTAVVAAALLLNTTGTENVAVGTDALVHNTAVGAVALFNNIDGSENIAWVQGQDKT